MNQAPSRTTGRAAPPNEVAADIIAVRGGPGNTAGGAGDVRTMQWHFKQSKKHTVEVPLPLQTLIERGVQQSCSSFTLQYKRGARILVT
jgi:hypothetical protein